MNADLRQIEELLTRAQIETIKAEAREEMAREMRPLVDRLKTAFAVKVAKDMTAAVEAESGEMFSVGTFYPSEGPGQPGWVRRAQLEDTQPAETLVEVFDGRSQHIGHMTKKDAREAVREIDTLQEKAIHPEEITVSAGDHIVSAIIDSRHDETLLVQGNGLQRICEGMEGTHVVVSTETGEHLMHIIRSYEDGLATLERHDPPVSRTEQPQERETAQEGSETLREADFEFKAKLIIPPPNTGEEESEWDLRCTKPDTSDGFTFYSRAGSNIEEHLPENGEPLHVQLKNERRIPVQVQWWNTEGATTTFRMQKLVD